MHVLFLTCHIEFICACIYLQSDKECGCNKRVCVLAPKFCVPHNPLVITIFSLPSCCVLMDLMMHDVISPHTL